MYAIRSYYGPGRTAAGRRGARQPAGDAEPQQDDHRAAGHHQQPLALAQQTGLQQGAAQQRPDRA